MPDEVKLRTPAPQPLPNDEQFTPGREPATAPEGITADDLMYASNPDKIAFYRNNAQQVANDNDCAVLLHCFALPHFQNCNGVMMAAIIPAEEGSLTPPIL